MSNTNDFSGVRVGDKLWSIQLGDCEVIKIYENSDLSLYSLGLESLADNGENEYYHVSGLCWDRDLHQSLFWSNPNIISPEKPVESDNFENLSISEMREALSKLSSFVKWVNKNMNN